MGPINEAPFTQIIQFNPTNKVHVSKEGGPLCHILRWDVSVIVAPGCNYIYRDWQLSTETRRVVDVMMRPI